jgi:Domain of unknown function (DUF4350)
MSGKRRWLRLVLPFAVVLALIIGTGIVHSLQEPDVTDPAFLNPGSAAAIGGSRLAGLLTGRGVTVDRVTKSSDALVAAYQGDVTLFLPAPGLMHAYYLRMLKLLPRTTRVVIVEPSGLTLRQGLIPVGKSGNRWATAAAPPGCALPEAARAGTAGVFHVYYGDVDGQTVACYDGALVGMRYAAAEVVLVGANEPFRNDRIAEHGNALLASGLLTAHRRVVWLDLHRGEPPPRVLQQTPDPNQVAAPPSLGTGGSPDPDFPVAGGRQRGDGSEPGGGDQGNGSPGEPPTPPYWKLLPTWAWAILGMLGLAGIAFALARARRLGPPVSEPLPVAVRAAETVEGRGRLYRRANARRAALATLRATTLNRLRSALDLPVDASRAETVVAVVARTGWPPEQVDAILYGAEPHDDATLVRLAAELDHLLHLSIDVRQGALR